MPEEVRLIRYTDDLALVVAAPKEENLRRRANKSVREE